MESWRPPIRKTEHLHRGRVSLPGARYFVTIVAESRKPWLGIPTRRQAALDVLKQWHSEGDGQILAATVMPDHVHVLFQLGDCLTVGQTIARWKTEIRRTICYAEDFQRDFWEHQLRANEEVEDYALYVFLNPYRAKLVQAGKIRPSWWAPEPEPFRFSALLDCHGSPPKEWIDWPDDRFSGLAHGE